jgi:hypothetical protein
MLIEPFLLDAGCASAMVRRTGGGGNSAAPASGAPDDRRRPMSGRTHNRPASR